MSDLGTYITNEKSEEMKVKGTTTLDLKVYEHSWGSEGLTCTCYPEAQKLLGSIGVTASATTAGERRITSAIQNSGEWVLQPDQNINPETQGA